MLVPPFFSDLTVRQVSSLHAAQRAAGFARARVVLVIADPRWGGGRRAEGHIAHALAGSATAGSLPTTSSSSTPTPAARPHPAGSPTACARSTSLPLLDDLPDEAAERVLVELVRSFRAEAVVNVNSGLLYKAMATYGQGARGLRADVPGAVLQRAAGLRQLGRASRCATSTAASTWSRGSSPTATTSRDWLRERHQLGPGLDDRLHVFRAPVDPDVPVAPAAEPRPDRRPQVFWAGRFDRQKRVDLAFEVARRMPEVDVRMWGEPVLHVGGVGAPPPTRSWRGRTPTSPSSTSGRPTPGSTPPAGTACRASCSRWR